MVPRVAWIRDARAPIRSCAFDSTVVSAPTRENSGLRLTVAAPVPDPVPTPMPPSFVRSPDDAVAPVAEVVAY